MIQLDMGLSKKIDDRSLDKYNHSSYRWLEGERLKEGARESQIKADRQR